MRRQRLGHLLEYSDPRRFGPANPPVQESRRELLSRLLPEPAQVVLHVVGCRQRFVERQRLLQPPLFVLLCAEVLGILQQQPPRPLEHLLAHDFGRLAVQGAAEVGELVVEEFDDMEVVEDDLRLGQVSQDRSPVRLRHVHSHRLDFSLAGP